jgi:hypothetical protein
MLTRRNTVESLNFKTSHKFQGGKDVLNQGLTRRAMALWQTLDGATGEKPAGSHTPHGAPACGKWRFCILDARRLIAGSLASCFAIA